MSGRIRNGKAVVRRGNGRAADSAAPLDLQQFLPYRLAVLADQMSRALAAIYSEQFDLSREEWRIMAALAQHGEQPTTHIGRIVTLDKMQVSRAMQRLEARALISRRTAPDDRRNKSVRLTSAGRALYADIVPRVLAREKDIIQSLSGPDAAALGRIIECLTAAAARMQP